ncbi:MAG: hypothetical protein D6737_01005 [Chloroflexi bacterium]|nr:MAG: hypothetical protein CUN54_00790 [Phototrophicales bacterium]RMF82712.1 MAG: hypothetical protein D6737_01005 [Chloroflexota bacterium]
MNASFRLSSQKQNVWPVVLIVGTVLIGLVVRFAIVPTSGLGASVSSFLPWLNQTEITTFYADDSGVIIPVSQRVVSDSQPDALLSLFNTTAGINTDVISQVSVENGVAQVDLSPQFSQSASELALWSVAQSVATWPGVDRVQLSANGTTIDFTAENITPVYYVRDELIVGVPVTASTPREALDAYLDLTTAPELTALPDDVQLLDYNFNPANGLLALDFSYTPTLREFAIAEPDAMRSVLTGLIATMTTFPEVSAVTLDFEGHSQLGLGQCSNLLRAPQTHPTILNDARLFNR